MFLGTYRPNLMDKGRIALPKKIREQLGAERMILTVGAEACVYGFSAVQWEEATKPVVSKSLFDDKQARDMRRKIYADAEEIDLDSQGRFVLPQRLKEYAGIREDIIIMGVGDHFEIWNKTTWEEYRTSNLTND